MRTNVEVDVHEKGLDELVTYRGFFLGWGIDWTWADDGIAHFTVALVEKPDRSVARVSTEKLRFA